MSSDYFDFSIKSQFVKDFEIKANSGSEGWKEKVHALTSSLNDKQKIKLYNSLRYRAERVKQKKLDSVVVEFLLNEYIKGEKRFSDFFYSILRLTDRGALLNSNSLAYLNKLLKKENKTKNDFLILSEFRPSFLTFKKESQPEVLYANKKEFSASYNSSKWGLLLSKANSGDDIALDSLINILKSETNVLLKVTGLFNDLRFVKQPKIKAYLKSYLFMENRTPKLDNGALGPKYASYAASILSKIEIDFPLEKKGHYDDSDIETLRKWYLENTNI